MVRSLTGLFAALALVVLAAAGALFLPPAAFALCLCVTIASALLAGYIAGRLRSARSFPQIANDIARLAAGGAPAPPPPSLSSDEKLVFDALGRAADELAQSGRYGELRTEQALFAGRQEALERLAAGFAGRFGEALAGARTSLAAVEQAATRGGAGREERLAAELTHVRRALEQATALVHGLRALAPAGVPPPTPSELADAVERAVAERRGRAARLGVRVDVARPATPVFAGAGAADIGAAVGPLLDNALDALEGRSGSIVVRVESGSGDDGPRVIVEDDGPGMPETDLARAFDPFFTTRPSADGLGLGLVFARAAAIRAGGALTLGARAGGGIRAVLQLPRHETLRHPPRSEPTPDDT